MGSLKDGREKIQRLSEHNAMPMKLIGGSMNVFIIDPQRSKPNSSSNSSRDGVVTLRSEVKFLIDDMVLVFKMFEKWKKYFDYIYRGIIFDFLNLGIIYVRLTHSNKIKYYLKKKTGFFIFVLNSHHLKMNIQFMKMWYNNNWFCEIQRKTTCSYIVYWLQMNFKNEF